jgi:hypothetical protein
MNPLTEKEREDMEAILVPYIWIDNTLLPHISVLDAMAAMQQYAELRERFDWKAFDERIEKDKQQLMDRIDEIFWSEKVFYAQKYLGVLLIKKS